MQTISIPLFAALPARTTYYTLSLEAERCPSFDLFYAHEHRDICLSPSLRPCNFQNGTQIILLDHTLAVELASYAEPVMQRRYGESTIVRVDECSAPEEWARNAPFAIHASKAHTLIENFKAKGAIRSQQEKGLPIAEVRPLLTK